MLVLFLTLNVRLYSTSFVVLSDCDVKKYCGVLTALSNSTELYKKSWLKVVVKSFDDVNQYWFK